MEQQDLNNRIMQLEQKVQQLSMLLATHQHTNDGTLPLRKNILLDRDQWIAVGATQFITQRPTGAVTSTQDYVHSISLGPDPVDVGFTYKSNNIQLDFLHTPSGAESFIRAYRKPLVASVLGTSISVTAGGTTVTIDGYNFATDELAGAVICITNSSGTFIEAQTIASNTSTVVTISGTWGATTNNATFLIFLPVYLGAAQTPFQRGYVMEGTAGGLRFGVGPTNGGQNGLLYMDSAGDLYWRPKTGAAVKLN